ncbi:hypothetical protein ACG9XX_06230, partial [Acinetobacter baumannii]
PIGCTVDFRGRLIHFEIILLNKLLMLGLCNKAFAIYVDIHVIFSASIRSKRHTSFKFSSNKKCFK